MMLLFAGFAFIVAGALVLPVSFSKTIEASLQTLDLILSLLRVELVEFWT